MKTIFPFPILETFDCGRHLHVAMLWPEFGEGWEVKFGNS